MLHVKPEVDLIKNSDLFDEEWYVSTYPDVATFEFDAATHFCRIGWRLKRNPSPGFNTEAYLLAHHDVAIAGINPLIHFLKWGRNEERTFAAAADDGLQNTLKSAEVLTKSGHWADASVAWSRVESNALDNVPLQGRAKVNASVTRRLADLGGYIDHVRAYEQAIRTRPPRIAIYTAIIGKYDSIKMPHRVDDRFGYHIFTDTPLKEASPWQVHPAPYENDDPTRVARYIKTHPHELFPDADLAIWIDANIMVTGDLYPIIESFLKSDRGLAAVPHPLRRTIYDEFEACSKSGKDERSVMAKQIAQYRAEGYDHDDLIESNFLIFQLRDHKVVDFLKRWWAEIDKKSRRDQLSINYALRKAGVSWHPITTFPKSMRDHEAVAFGSHGRHDDGVPSLLVDALPARSPTGRADAAKAKSIKTTDLKVYQFTPAKTANAYYTLFPLSLKENGVDVTCTVDWSEIQGETGMHPVAHFHQLEPLYHKDTAERTWEAARALCERLESLKNQGVALIHTWHNPVPHNDKYIEQDLWVYGQIGRIFDLVVVHLKSAFTYITTFVPESKLRYMTHPSFYNSYGPPGELLAGRKKFDVEAADKLFLAFGEIKPYKGIDTLEAAWRTASQNPALKSWNLLVAGRLHNCTANDLFRHSDRVEIRAGYVNDADIPAMFASSDVAVFTHRRIWTSGAAYLAMSYGMPVIMPASPHTKEYIREGDNGFLYDPNGDEGSGLANAMARAAESPLLDHIRLINRYQAKRNDFSVKARVLETFYLEAAESMA